MRKLLILVLVTLMAIPFIPVTAQDDAVVARLEEYNANMPKGYGTISVEDLNVKLAESEPFLLDVREVDEYAAGHLADSINIPLRTLGQNLNLLPGFDTEIVVICKSGGRAMLGGVTLQILGYNALILKGGYDAWAGEDNFVTTDPFEGTAGDVAADATLVAAADAFLSNLPQGWGMVTPANLNVELAENPPLLVDVRTVDEWNTAGYIEGAQNVPIAEFMAMKDQWPADKDANIVIYCASGTRGAVAFVMMNLMGYTNVRNMSGGINAWIAAEFPVVGAQPPAEETFDLEALTAAYLTGMPGSFNAIRVADVEAKIAAGEEFTLVDVRSADEYAEGFIPGAINIPLQELTDHLDMLPNLDADIVVYCGSGHRSTMATTALNLLGYTNATSMLSGIKAWTQPLTTEPTEVVMGAAPEIDPALFAAVDAFIKGIPAGYFSVSAANLNTEIIEGAEIVLIDVRTDSEWAEGHIEGAIHLTLRDLMTRKAEWPAEDANIVFYGSTSHRGAMAMVLARMFGYTNVRSLGGGTGAWTSAGFELVQ
ncbi:MAG: hypothetical protein H6673_05490 [Anaerolineales bacterium]|nr:hypothetical protein [Anaerolineales bacterium]